MARITQIIVTSTPETIIKEFYGWKGMDIIALEGEDIFIDMIRDWDDNPSTVYAINNPEKISRVCIAALLKMLEEGQSHFIFLTPTITTVNRALVSRCLTTYTAHEEKLTQDILFKNLNRREKEITKDILNKREIHPKDIYSEKLNYREIFKCLARAYSNRPMFEEVNLSLWKRIESIILQENFMATRFSLWQLMEK